MPKYWEWTEDVLARFSDILSTASIRQAVYASLYSYDKDLQIMRAIFEGWCPDTNTFHTVEGEFYISLWDLKKLGGLPIVGEIYDETVSQLSILKSKTEEKNLTVLATCTFLFTAFHYLLKESKDKGEVSAQQWIDFWCKWQVVYPPPVKSRRTTKNPPASTQNPSGEIEPRSSDEWTEEERSLFEKLACNDSRRAKFYLPAHLSCWLCIFVLPEDSDRLIRPATFEIASMMEEGRVFSLAITVLASIYKGLNGLATSMNPGYSRSFFPTHYLYGWIANYFDTYHAINPSPTGPHMTKYSGPVGARNAKPEEARKLMHEGRKFDTKRFMLNKHKVDVLLDNGDLDALGLDYRASLRSSYLCLRLSNGFHLEPYNPHRFSRQFGFCQDIPGVLNRGSDKPDVTCFEALKYWQVFLFTGSMSRVYLPSPSFRWDENVTLGFTKWWKELYPKDLRKKVDILVHSTGSDHKTKKRDHHGDTRNQSREQAVPPKSKVVVPKAKGHIENKHHSDSDSEIDPKHDRRGKRKVSVLDADDVRLDAQIFEGVSSASRMPS
ncbi:uncharacterized protein LOC141629116 [Silene latifolia]|uniref:uncharacterized protein LOC141629116 n=1 Tax=Silene latifolia TaxID=37657 RepID=UPI003D7783BB